MIEVRNIAWAAGFLEGDGYFSMSPVDSGRCNDLVGATCADKDILERLQSLFGGNIRQVSGRGLGPLTKKEIFSWRLHGAKAIGLMMTVYTFMGDRRRTKIQSILSDWKARPAKGKSSGGLAALARATEARRKEEN